MIPLPQRPSPPTTSPQKRQRQTLSKWRQPANSFASTGESFFRWMMTMKGLVRWRAPTQMRALHSSPKSLWIQVGTLVRLLGLIDHVCWNLINNYFFYHQRLSFLHFTASLSFLLFHSIYYSSTHLHFFLFVSVYVTKQRSMKPESNRMEQNILHTMHTTSLVHHLGF